MSARERIGVGAACVFWEALWLFSLALQVEFFNVPPPPAAQTWCDPDAACELIAFNQWLDTFPRWTRFIPLAITIVFGFIWAHSEYGSGLRKLSAVAFGGAATLASMRLLSSVTLPDWATSTLSLILIIGMASLPLGLWLATRPSNQPEVQ